jgi:hypothetical protein
MPQTMAVPSVHVRAIITWIAIFPLAVYIVVPQLMRVYFKLWGVRQAR